MKKTTSRNINILIGFLFFLLFYSCKTKEVEIKSNERGVMFKKFDGGLDTSKVYNPGKYNIPDYDRIIIYSIDSKIEVEYFVITSKDEIQMKVGIEHKFKLISKKIPLLHKYIGKGYHKFVVIREIEAVVTDYFKNILSNDILLYEDKEYGKELFTKAKKSIGEKYVDLESLKINNVTLLKEE
jgi:hypothetical protein